MNNTSTRQKVGLTLAGLISASQIFSVLNPTPAGQTGPPLTVLVLDSALGIIGVVAVVIAWRSGNRAALRVAAGAVIIAMLTSVPAFFVDVPVAIKGVVGFNVLISIAAVVLMFSPSRRPVPVGQ